MRSEKNRVTTIIDFDADEADADEDESVAPGDADEDDEDDEEEDDEYEEESLDEGVRLPPTNALVPSPVTEPRRVGPPGGAVPPRNGAAPADRRSGGLRGAPEPRRLGLLGPLSAYPGTLPTPDTPTHPPQSSRDSLAAVPHLARRPWCHAPTPADGRHKTKSPA
jgi:hypothetical protein